MPSRTDIRNSLFRRKFAAYQRVLDPEKSEDAKVILRDLAKFAKVGEPYQSSHDLMSHCEGRRAMLHRIMGWLSLSVQDLEDATYIAEYDDV